MIGAMDLNASPLPEEDEDTFEGHIEEYAAQERVESGAEILRRVLLSFSFIYLFFLFNILFILSSDILYMIARGISNCP